MQETTKQTIELVTLIQSQLNKHQLLNSQLFKDLAQLQEDNASLTSQIAQLKCQIDSNQQDKSQLEQQ